VASANPTCAGTTVTFTPTTTNSGSTPTYDWKLNGLSTGVTTYTYSSGGLQQMSYFNVTTTNVTEVSAIFRFKLI
jgi:hypothetical protein